MAPAASTRGAGRTTGENPGLARNVQETAKSQLDDRKTIDRAKAIPEEQDDALMRHVAMNENKKIAEVARSIITAAELL